MMVFAGLVVGVFVVSLGPISDGDIYWHLAAGRQIVRQGWLPRVDPFTVSAAGRPWTDVHWLFQLGAFALYSAFGFLGLAAAKSTLLALGASLLVWAAERMGGADARLPCAVTVLGGLILDRHLVPLRPGLLTMVFLALFLLGLDELRREPERRRWPLVLLPIVQVVWCNCQGLAPLGPALVAIYLGGTWLASRGFRRWPCLPENPAASRPLAILLATCLLATLVTPHGIQGLILPVRLLARITPGHGNVFSSAVAENIPPFVLERTAPELVWHFRWVLGFLAASFALLRPQLRLTHLTVLLTFLALALLANRNLPLFYWMAAPLVVVALTSTSQRTGGARWLHTPWLRRILALALVCEGGIAFGLQSREPSAGSATPFHFPTQSVRRLIDRHVTGAVFAADHHGGYLTFAAPDLRPYIDTRLVLHTAEEYADYLALFDQPTRFDGLAEHERFRAVVLPTVHPDRYLGLIWHLANSPDWHLAYTDGYEVLFLRDGPDVDLSLPSTVDAILADLSVRFGDGPLAEAAQLNLARLLVVLGKPAQAEHVLSRLSSRAAAALRARALFVAGELKAAEALSLVLLAQDPRDHRTLCLLAESAASTGHLAQALTWLRQAVAIAPYDPQVRSLAQRIEAGVTSRQADEASTR